MVVSLLCKCMHVTITRSDLWISNSIQHQPTFMSLLLTWHTHTLVYSFGTHSHHCYQSNLYWWVLDYDFHLHHCSCIFIVHMATLLIFLYIPTLSCYFDDISKTSLQDEGICLSCFLNHLLFCVCQCGQAVLFLQKMGDHSLLEEVRVLREEVKSLQPQLKEAQAEVQRLKAHLDADKQEGRVRLWAM